jgi:hypothetical protein
MNDLTELRDKAPSYTVEELKVSDLQVDHRVQREQLKSKRIEDMKRNFNPNALGVITVSRRKDRGLYIIDGWHRTETVRQLTDNVGTVTCHVFEGLTVVEEALMFLDLNFAEKPNVMDKFKVRLEAGDETAVLIDNMARAFDWRVKSAPGDGNIQAIQTLERLNALSIKIEAEPNLVHIVLLVVTKAWGHDRFGTQAVVMEGLGRLFAEHSSRINVTRLIEKLKGFKGGPRSLHGSATESARHRGIRVPMAVADIITEAYNKGSYKDKLPVWRHR